MSETSPVLGLPLIQPAQAQKHVTHNEALRLLDAVTQLSVVTAPQAAPPASPLRGQRYIVAAPGSGAWAGQGGQIAVFDDPGWLFFAPAPGWRADVTESGVTLRYDGTDWQPLLPVLQNLPSLGVATTADEVNRLAVASDAVLFSHAGQGHQLKINKAAAGETASLLFQTGFSGRAEMGTAGNDDWAVKVSVDGAAWKTALRVEATGGALHVPQGQTYFDDVFILNNGVYSFVIPWSNPARILMWLAVNITGFHYLFSITGTMTGATNFAAMFVNPAGTLNFRTGPLTGTTGPAGAITLSIEDSGGVRRMYVENRLGSNRLFTMATLGK